MAKEVYRDAIVYTRNLIIIVKVFMNITVVIPN